MGADGVKRIGESTVLEGLRYTEGFLLGTSISGLIFLISVILLDNRFSIFFYSQLGTILPVLAAIYAAYLALQGTNKQIQSNLEIEVFRRESQLEAARASLPLALSQLSDVCRRAIIFTYETNRHAADAVETAKGFTMPEGALSILKECISYSEINVASRLANLIRHYQVAYSRTVSSYEQPEEGSGPFRDTFDWAVVSLLIENCFNFSRGSSNTIPAKITEGSFASVFCFSLKPNFWADANFMDEVKRRDMLDNLEFKWDRE